MAPPGEQPRQQAGEVCNQRGAGVGRQERYRRGQHRADGYLCPDAEFDAADESVGEAVRPEQVAVQAEDGSARAEDTDGGGESRQERAEEADHRHLCHARQHPDGEKEGVKTPAGRGSLDKQAAQRQRHGVAQQVRDPGVGVDAGHQRPRASQQRQGEREHAAQPHESGNLLADEDDGHHGECRHRRAVGAVHTTVWSPPYKNPSTASRTHRWLRCHPSCMSDISDALADAFGEHADAELATQAAENVQSFADQYDEDLTAGPVLDTFEEAPYSEFERAFNWLVGHLAAENEDCTDSREFRIEGFGNLAADPDIAA